MLREIEGPFFFSGISGLVSVVTISVVMVCGDGVCFMEGMPWRSSYPVSDWNAEGVRCF
jgi:hypothetical protein